MSGGLNVRVYNNVFTIQLQDIKCHTVNKSCNIKTPQTQCITDRSMLLWKQNHKKKIPENTDRMIFSIPEKSRYLVNICRHIVYPNRQDMMNQKINHKNLQQFKYVEIRDREMLTEIQFSDYTLC